MSAFVPSSNQRMFHGTIRAGVLADQLAARFNDRQHRTHVEANGDTALIQIGSRHGTPVTLHLADITGGVLVTMSRDRDWLDRAADASEMLERAATQPVSLLAMIPDVIGELGAENITPQIWDAINDLMSLSRSLAGEEHAPQNPKVCTFCGTANPADAEKCLSCGAPLPVDLPRICPKCGRAHTSDALFCQACGTRLVEG
jgi:ribosomal protein L40E